MSNPSFTPMTDTQREEVRLKRIADQEWAKEHLKTIYMDENYWREIASELGCRLPSWWIPGTEVKYLRRISKKLNFDLKLFVESTGFSNIKEFCQANSKFTALALSGLVLEWYKTGGSDAYN